MLRSVPVNQPIGSLRSPLPLLAGGILVALVLIALVTLPPKQAAPDPSKVETLSEREAITLVAEAMRSGESAARVSADGKARFDDGSWFVSVDDAQFHFSQRNRIVIADNEPARSLQFLGPPSR